MGSGSIGNFGSCGLQSQDGKLTTNCLRAERSAGPFLCQHLIGKFVCRLEPSLETLFSFRSQSSQVHKPDTKSHFSARLTNISSDLVFGFEFVCSKSTILACGCGLIANAQFLPILHIANISAFNGSTVQDYDLIFSHLKPDAK